MWFLLAFQPITVPLNGRSALKLETGSTQNLVSPAKKALYHLLQVTGKSHKLIRPQDNPRVLHLLHAHGCDQDR